MSDLNKKIEWVRPNKSQFISGFLHGQWWKHDGMMLTWCMMATGVGNCWLIVVCYVLFQWYSIIYWEGRWIFWHTYIYIYTHPQLLLCTCPSPNLGCTSGVVLWFLGLHQKAVFQKTRIHTMYTQTKQDMMIWWYDQKWEDSQTRSVLCG